MHIRFRRRPEGDRVEHADRGSHIFLDAGVGVVCLWPAGRRLLGDESLRSNGRCRALLWHLFHQNPDTVITRPGSANYNSSTALAEGVFYFPTTGLTFSGSSWGTIFVLVAETIAISGSSAQ